MPMAVLQVVSVAIPIIRATAALLLDSCHVLVVTAIVASVVVVMILVGTVLIGL